MRLFGLRQRGPRRAGSSVLPVIGSHGGVLVFRPGGLLSKVASRLVRGVVPFPPSSGDCDEQKDGGAGGGARASPSRPVPPLLPTRWGSSGFFTEPGCVTAVQPCKPSGVLNHARCRCWPWAGYPFGSPVRLCLCRTEDCGCSADDYKGQHLSEKDTGCTRIAGYD